MAFLLHALKEHGGIMKKANWENRISLFFGVWLFITPWILMERIAGASFYNATMWNAWITGFIIASFAIMALLDLRPWEEMVNMMVGVWLILSPWILGYAVDRTLAWNSVIAGMIVSVLSVLALPVAQQVKLQKQRI